eukprot:TRINITY_DN22881_c0_g1_i6.p1 TRINITY_DN22881_c0_g1~~TRINITY_DN22881_c0_g1_i6.p1  ORF type:complete len:155 (-),score=7.25 TRINITY_DN22881_c0_g1_i6:1952-2416(-)
MDRELLTMIWRTVIGPLTVTLGKSFTGYRLPPNTWMIWTLLWGNAKSKFLKDIFKHCFVKTTRQSVLQKKGRVEEWFSEVVAYAICRYYQGSSIAFHATKYPILVARGVTSHTAAQGSNPRHAIFLHLRALSLYLRSTTLVRGPGPKPYRKLIN